MLNKVPFPLPYIIRTLFENECKEERNSYYIGDWYEGFTYGEYFSGGFAIKWMQIHPRLLKHRGRLVVPQMIDVSKEFEEILKKYNIPYE